MRRSFRCFVGAAVAVVAAGALTACNASPYAASVNGTIIKQTSLNQEIAYGDQSPGYVDLEASIVAQATGVNTVSYVGSGTGTHSTQWAAVELSNLVQAQIIHDAVVARGLQPNTAMLDAARGVLEALTGATEWAQVPAAYRDELVQRLAEHAELETPGSDASQLESAYDQRLADFYTQVCVRQISVSVTATNGSIDFPSSLGDANGIVTDYNDATSKALGSSSQVTGGTVTCYSQADMESLGASFMTTVMKLAPGSAAAPQKTAFGYNVTAVISRHTEPFAGPVAKALQAALYEFEPSADTALVGLEKKAKVQVNPAYGTWSIRATSQSGPGIISPTPSSAAPGAPDTTVPSYNPFAPAS